MSIKNEIESESESGSIGLMIGGDSQSFIKTAIIPIREHHVFFDSEIGDPSEYRTLRHMLYTAQETDRFVFFINSIGGQLYTTLSIIEAIKQTAATVHSVVDGECMSAATLLLLNSDEITITDSAVVMCHAASHGIAGNVQGVKRQAEFIERQWRELEKKTYAGFLTNEEMSDMAKGLELYFDANESKKRLKRWAALKSKK
jgi:ATP-dependent Clp protease, protease subunit